MAAPKTNLGPGDQNPNTEPETTIPAGKTTVSGAEVTDTSTLTNQSAAVEGSQSMEPKERKDEMATDASATAAPMPEAHDNPTATSGSSTMPVHNSGTSKPRPAVEQRQPETATAADILSAQPVQNTQQSVSVMQTLILSRQSRRNYLRVSLRLRRLL